MFIYCTNRHESLPIQIRLLQYSFQCICILEKDIAPYWIFTVGFLQEYAKHGVDAWAKVTNTIAIYCWNVDHVGKGI